MCSILKKCLLGFFLCSSTFAVAQQEIEVKNGSFEGKPRAGNMNTPIVNGWLDCNEKGQTPVDVQPGFFNVTLPASEGETYLGMVVRMDGSVEGVGQILSKPLNQDQYYAMSLDLTNSQSYLSITRMRGNEENFGNPVVLKIFGGNDECEQFQLLAESEVVDNMDWKKYYFKFLPDESYNFLTFVLDNVGPDPYNGNLLIDNASNIFPIDEGEDLETFFKN